MKRLFALILSFLMILSVSVTANAANANLTETDEKVVIKDSNWAYEKVNVYGYELDEYIGSDAEVSLPWSFAKEYVTSVGDYAFNENTTVTSVDTTSVIESIGSYTFNGCTSLNTITLYASLSSIGEGCFYGTSALTSVNLEDTVITAVSPYCFADSGIIEITLPDTCKSIGNMAFYQCGDLSKITIPASVEDISDTAFMNCDDFTIYCYTDSYAHEYAEENNIPYVLIDAPYDVTFILGDADGDGNVTILDATKIQRVLVDLDHDSDGMIKLRGDTNENGLDIMDATRIQRWIAGYIVTDPIGSEVTRTING